ncbi:hypothetical protein NC651_000222 [Populus alba x Populus x berolinensis]|nr:hypothetical protein NC651_000222 [Populus alba x Populus x berolinensis]
MFLDLGIKFEVMGFLKKLQIRFVQYQYLEGSVKSSLETSLDIDSMCSFSDSSGGGLVRLKIIHLSSTTDLRIEIFLSFKDSSSV